MNPMPATNHLLSDHQLVCSSLRESPNPAFDVKQLGPGGQLGQCRSTVRCGGMNSHSRVGRRAVM